jgi:hypothetical protein
LAEVGELPPQFADGRAPSPRRGRSSVSETYGHQEGSASNGHFGCTCYHLLFLFNQFSELERVMLRRGNRGSAKYWRRVLLPVIEPYRGLDIPKFFRRLRLACASG